MYRGGHRADEYRLTETSKLERLCDDVQRVDGVGDVHDLWSVRPAATSESETRAQSLSERLAAAAAASHSRFSASVQRTSRRAVTTTLLSRRRWLIES